MKTIIFFIALVAVIMIPLGVYWYRFIKKTIEFYTKKKIGKATRVVTILVAIAISICCATVFNTLALPFYHIIIIQLLLELINLIMNRLIKVKEKKAFVIWQRVFKSALVPVILTTIIMIFGYFNIKNIIETDYTVYSNKIVNEDGYTVALISDSHFGTAIDKEEIAEVCDRISKKNPDIVVLDGDMVDESTTYEQLNELFEECGKIKSRYGVFYVYGNHDLSSYSPISNYSEDDLVKAIKDNGIIILKDETYEINDDLVIVGRADASFGETKKRATIEELLSKVDKNRYILLLDHQPLGLEENAKAKVDLQLSGHTHGGQIWPLPILFDVFNLTEMTYGYKQIDDYNIIVTSGVSGWGYAVRTGAHSEYVIVNIEKN